MLILASGAHYNPTPFFAAGATALAFFTAIGVFLRPFRRFAQKAARLLDAAEDKPAQYGEAADGQRVMLRPPEPGIFTRLANTDTTMKRVEDTVNQAVEKITSVAHIGETLLELRTLAAEAAVHASAADQRSKESVDLFSAQIEALHHQAEALHTQVAGLHDENRAVRVENQAMRTALFDLALYPPEGHEEGDT